MSRNAQLSSPNLTALRIRSGLSVRQLADASKVGQRTIHAAENGRVPHQETQERIVRALNARRGARQARLTNLDVWPLAPELASVA